MAIQSSGAVALSEVQSEFGGVNPVSLSEYYRSGTYVPAGATGVPANGAISIGDFYGASNSYAFTIAANTRNANVRTLAIADGWDQSTPLSVTVNSGVWCYSDTTSTGGLVLAGSFAGGVTVVNSGNIIGMGGAANQVGGPALQITTSDTVNITNNSGAYIAGGGGGGGGSFTVTIAGFTGTSTRYAGGGGAGQAGAFGDTSSRNGSLIGWNSEDVTIGKTCTGINSTSDYRSAVQSRGYGYGGGGGSGASAGGYTTYWICDGSGGWYQTTSYRQGGAKGGRALTGGSTGTLSSNAGGFWGQAGGAGGGAGGAAISGTYAGYTNNGTVYGAVV